VGETKLKAIVANLWVLVINMHNSQRCINAYPDFDHLPYLALWVTNKCRCYIYIYVCMYVFNENFHYAYPLLVFYDIPNMYTYPMHILVWVQGFQGFSLELQASILSQLALPKSLPCLQRGVGADTLKFNLHIIGRAKKGCEFNQKRCELKNFLCFL
jgi:hypothetical protein